MSNINSNLSARKIYNAHSISALRVGSINEIPPPDTMCKYLSNEEGRAGSSFHHIYKKRQLSVMQGLMQCVMQCVMQCDMQCVVIV